jgi:hypothetical protein
MHTDDVSGVSGALCCVCIDPSVDVRTQHMLALAECAQARKCGDDGCAGSLLVDVAQLALREPRHDTAFGFVRAAARRVRSVAIA